MNVSGVIFFPSRAKEVKKQKKKRRSQVSGQTDVQPASCGSYVRMENDNSYLAGDCKKWKNGKWGIHNAKENRLYNHVAYVYGTRRWLLSPPSVFECDDLLVGVTTGDFWKVYVR